MTTHLSLLKSFQSVCDFFTAVYTDVEYSSNKTVTRQSCSSLVVDLANYSDMFRISDHLEHFVYKELVFDFITKHISVTNATVDNSAQEQNVIFE